MTKTKVSQLCGVIFIILMVSCEDHSEPNITKHATKDTIAAFVGFEAITSLTDSTYFRDSNTPHGSALFIQEDSFVVVTISLQNFPPNSVHAVHIHNGSCEQPGMHWNQNLPMTKKFCNQNSLGIPWSKPMAGDVGNVSVDYEGSGEFTLKTDLWSLVSNDQTNIIGKSLVVHERYEDFSQECDPLHTGGHGHFNAKVACGVITMK